MRHSITHIHLIEVHYQLIIDTIKIYCVVEPTFKKEVLYRNVKVKSFMVKLLSRFWLFIRAN